MKTISLIFFIISFSIRIGFAQENKLYASVVNTSEFSISSESEVGNFTYGSNLIEILEITNITYTNLRFTIGIDRKSPCVVTLAANTEFFTPVNYSIFNSNGNEISNGEIINEIQKICFKNLEKGTYIFHIYIDSNNFQVFRIKI
ncbi:MAG: hypothetical protein WHW07_09545 [Bacteroidales bacterium]|jgi:hypothetical protein|nr:hypothetical protein [Bacteroidales bacterium]HOL97114.1 hypothetical protein [Bacteroidales bacterium]HOM35407.1 hypothetical protein [Bacteroidales bacterium]HPD23102.1 hypothetical protein [Bacteroidales bacterium]HRS99390.1 hypothetical protein [Bacteroidales bacterium]